MWPFRKTVESGDGDTGEAVRLETMQTALNELSEQVAKFMRWMYHMQKQQNDTVASIESKIDSKMEEIAQLSAKNLDFVVRSMVSWLDDLDALSEPASLVVSTSPLATPDMELRQRWQQQLLTGLASVGILEIKVLGELFNPRIAEALGTESVAPGQIVVPDNTVIKVIRRGFSQGQSLYRKAQVQVYKELSDG